MEIHGGMYNGDAGQKHNAETLWNYAFMHLDEIGIIVGGYHSLTHSYLLFLINYFFKLILKMNLPRNET